MSLKDVELKKEYRSLLDNVVNDFYIPVLRNSGQSRTKKEQPKGRERGIIKR